MTYRATLRMPVGLRVDLSAIQGESLELLDSCERGVGQAAARGQSRIAALTAAPVALALGETTFRWCGPDCDAIPEAARRRLEDSLRERIRVAVSRIPPPREETRTGWARDSAPPAEPADATRWTPDGEYLIASYDDRGANIPLPVTAPAEAPAVEETLCWFENVEEILEGIRQFYRNPAPRGNRVYGVYGMYATTGLPTIFWLKEAPDFIRFFNYVAVYPKDGKIIGSDKPVGLEPRTDYHFRALLKPKSKEGVEYWFELLSSPNSKPTPAYLSREVRSDLSGRELHFHAPRTTIEVVTVTAKAPPQPVHEGPPSWQSWGVSPLGWEADNGAPPDVWLWYAWLNIQPAELRQDRIIRAIFERWARTGHRFNALMLNVLAMDFYKDFCQAVALEMLAESRCNMEGFLKVIQQPNHPWADQFDTVVRYLGPVGARAVEAETALGSGTYEMQLATTRSHLEYLEGLYRSQEESLSQGRGGLPGGIVRPEDLDELRTQIANMEAARQTSTSELATATTTIGAAQTLEPLLVVLTLRGGEEITSISGAIARYAPGRTAERPSEWVRREFGALIKKTYDAEEDVNDNPDKVYQLSLVREVANRRLQGWFAANPFYAEAVRRLIEGPGVLGWLAIGIGLIVITFACPPLGAGLALGIGGLSLASSVSDYFLKRRFARVRLAQYGFIPLASQEEVDAALRAVVLDAVFLLLDIQGFGSALKTVGRSAARETAEAFGRSMERVLEGVRRIETWPGELVSRVRRQVETLAKQEGALAGRSVEEAVQLTQAEMALRYERHLAEIQEELERLLQNPKLKANELEQWLNQRIQRPDAFLDDLAAREIQEGSALWDKVSGKLRSGARPRIAPTFEFLPAMSAEAEQALRQELGPLAELLNPNSLSRLGSVTQVPYPTLARRLRYMLVHTEDPARSLGLLEDLVHGRSNADAILHALELQGRPGMVLEQLTPTLLDSFPGGSVDELIDAMARPTEAGTIERFYLHTRVGGEVALARDIAKDGRVMIQRWGGPERGWQIYRRFGPRPQVQVGAEAIRAAEQSTLASVVEGSAKATRALARLSRRGRHVLLEELEDTVRDPALARRLLEAVDDLPDSSLDALLAIKRADVATGGLVSHTWIDVMEHSQGWRDELLRLLGEVHDVVDEGLAEAVRRGMSGATNIQGSLGHLHAAVTLRRAFPNARMSFEVAAAEREIDIVLHDGGRRIDVEVKTNLEGELSISLSQIRKDLIRHASDGGRDLLYLYHPDAASRLAEVKAAMLNEAQSLAKKGVLSAAAAKEIERRLDDIVKVYQLH